MGRELVQISELSTDEKKQINESVPYLPPEVSKFGTSGYCLPKDLDIDYIRHDMTIYPDDIWIVTPPKCGTTWMQEIVWLIHTDVDLKSAQCNQFYRIPFLEECFILPSFLKLIPKPDFELTEKNEENVQAFFAHSFDYVESLQRPRIIKTHLPLELLPDKLLETCKVNQSISISKISQWNSPIFCRFY